MNFDYDDLANRLLWVFMGIAIAIFLSGFIVGIGTGLLF